MSNKETSNKELNIETEKLDTDLDNTIQEFDMKEIQDNDDIKVEDEVEDEDEYVNKVIENNDDEIIENNNVSLQLGDIIELYTHQMVIYSEKFYIKFINSKKVINKFKNRNYIRNK